jgi:Gas vesicle synthesis protein GvpL/GvpF
MPWYVFALVDRPPAGPKGKGLSGALGLRSVPGGLAVVERRADVPPAEFGPLKRHHDVVAALAARVPAILPVRFGTLLDDDAIDDALADRGEEIEQALEAVRYRVQFTWRRKARTSRRAPARTKVEETSDLSGTDYLRRAARTAKPSPPASWRSLRAALAPLISAEVYQSATATTPESLYHLVARDTVARYSTAATELRRADAALTLTGPWAPFAFAPRVIE